MMNKLLASIRNNPKDVRMGDACKAAEMLGFVNKRSKSGHRAYTRTKEPVGLNFQDRGDGKIPTYQARQLVAMIDKYGQEQ